jgi:hypothetical protein
MGILTGCEPLSTLYTSRTRRVPGPSSSKIVLFSEPFGFYNSGDGDRDG